LSLYLVLPLLACISTAILAAVVFAAILLFAGISSMFRAEKVRLALVVLATTLFMGLVSSLERTLVSSGHERNLIVLEPGSRATVVEHHIGLGAGAYFANSGTEIRVEEGAELHHYKIQDEGAEAVHVATQHVHLESNALYDAFTLTTGARLSRHEVSVRLAGPGAECHLNGAYMVRGKQHCDTTTTIEHMAPRTSCREVFKGVIDDPVAGLDWAPTAPVFVAWRLKRCWGKPQPTVLKSVGEQSRRARRHA